MLSGVISSCCRVPSLGNLPFLDCAQQDLKRHIRISEKIGLADTGTSDMLHCCGICGVFTSALVSPLCSYIVSQPHRVYNGHSPRKAAGFLVQRSEFPIFIFAKVVDFRNPWYSEYVGSPVEKPESPRCKQRGIFYCFSSTSMTVSTGSGRMGLSPSETNTRSG